VAVISVRAFYLIAYVGARRYLSFYLCIYILCLSEYQEDRDSSDTSQLAPRGLTWNAG